MPNRHTREKDLRLKTGKEGTRKLYVATEEKEKRPEHEVMTIGQKK